MKCHHKELAMKSKENEAGNEEQRQPGSAKGILHVLSEDDEHLDDFKEYMP